MEKLVGVGGMGLVYKAVDQALDTVVAVKILRPELTASKNNLKRFQNELLLARQVTQRNVVRVHDIQQHNEHWFINMDYVEGESLAARLDREGALSPAAAAEITRQLALGLDAAHSMQVIHRDLKPANILLDQSGNAFISDFGVARSLQADQLTQMGAIVGTPDYLAPEQVAGESIDHRSDQYALGLILCEMLTGKLPFNATTATEMLNQRLVISPSSPALRHADIPAELRQICEQLMQRKPDKRFRSAAEVAALLAGSKGPRRRHWLWPAVLVLAVVIVGVVLVWQNASQQQLVPPAKPQAREVLAVLPAAVSGSVDQADQVSAQDVADSVNLLLSNQLLRRSQTPVLAAYSNQNVLRQLNYNASQATEHLDQILEVTGATRQLLVNLDFSSSPAQMQWQLQQNGAVIWQSSIRISSELHMLVSTVQQQVDQLAAELDLSPSHAAGQLSDLSIASLAGLQRGLQYYVIGSWQRAQAELEQATQTSPEMTFGWYLLSRVYAATGNLDAARSSIDKATQSVSDDPLLTALINARSAELSGEYSDAVAIFESLINTYPAIADLRLLLGQAQGEGGDFETGLNTLAAYAADLPNDPKAWYLLAKFSIQSGQARVAIDDYLVKSLVIQNRLNNRQGQADVTNAMGVAYDRLGQLDLAIRHFRDAAELREEVGDQRGFATSLRNLAGILAIQGDIEAAEGNLLQAEQSLLPLGNTTDLANVYNDIGFLEEEKGNYQQALEYYRKTLRLQQDLNDSQGIALSFTNIGYIYYQQNQYDNALVYWLQARDEFAEIGDLTGQAQTQQQMALLQISKGDLVSAENLLQNSLQIARSNQMNEETAAAALSLAELYRYRGHYGEAKQLVNDAARLYRERQDRRGILESVILGAEIDLDLNAIESAQQSVQSLELETADNPDQGWRYLAVRSRLAARTGQFELASDYLDQAASLGSNNPIVNQLIQLYRMRLELLQPELSDTALTPLEPAELRDDWYRQQQAYWLNGLWYVGQGEHERLTQLLRDWQIPGNTNSAEPISVQVRLWNSIIQWHECSMRSTAECSSQQTAMQDALEQQLQQLPADLHASFLANPWLPEVVRVIPAIDNQQ